MKPHAPIRIGDSGVAATHGVGAAASAATLKEVRAHPSVAEPRVRRRRSQWVERFTSPRVCASVLGFSLLLLVVSGVVATKYLGQQTRGAEAEAMAALAGGPAIPSADLEEFRREAELAQSRLILDRQELKKVVERIEGDARRRGWQVELELLPPVNRPGGVQRLIAYPVVMKLSPARADTIPGFGSLIEWLDGVSADPRNAAVTALSLDVAGKRRGSARVEIQVLGWMVNDQAAPE
jgi:hypothetical protein